MFRVGVGVGAGDDAEVDISYTPKIFIMRAHVLGLV